MKDVCPCLCTHRDRICTSALECLEKFATIVIIRSPRIVLVIGSDPDPYVVAQVSRRECSGFEVVGSKVAGTWP